MRVIVLEGINAAGKSSVATRLSEALRERGCKSLHADPAAYGLIGRIARGSVVDHAIVSNPNLDAVLFTALRVEGALRLMQDALADDLNYVVLERWSLAVAAYGAADGARPGLVEELRRLLSETLTADITLLLDVDGERAIERIRNHEAKNRFEARGADYLNSVAASYREAARHDHSTIVISAGDDITAVMEQVMAALMIMWPDWLLTERVAEL